MTSIVISSGHGKYIRGASGHLDEVDEARRVVDRVATMLRTAGVGVKTFHDDVSHSQNENLNRIVSYHNAQTRDLDVSIHFNAYQSTSKAMGTECLYLTQDRLADEVAAAIATASGLIDRGPKKRTDLYFLNNTNEPAILIETCFVDSKADADIYRSEFEAICQAIAESISGQRISPPDPDEPLPPDSGMPPPSERPILGEGDSGSYVASVQRSLGIPNDGDFGPLTDSAVKGFQTGVGIATDGVVGEQTWTYLDELDWRNLTGSAGLAPDLIERIIVLAGESEIASYSWRDRGQAPAGYISGMALSFALAASWLLHETAEHSAAVAMAVADTGDSDTDALAWYRGQFQLLGMDNSIAGIDTLRHLFVLLIGLGMRESSGRYCEGRDMSASNVSADTAEAGLFQTSWNIKTASPEIPRLLDWYWADPNGFLGAFCDGVKPKSDELENYGNGEGASYQFLSKYSPAFHTMVTAIGLRTRRQHWGPINRREVELREEADALLRDVQAIVEGTGDGPDEPVVSIPTVTITIDPPGSARVVVVGAERTEDHKPATAFVQIGTRARRDWAKH